MDQISGDYLDDIVRQNQGGKRGDLAIIHRRLISLACVGNNPFHLWLNTSFEERNIFTPEALKHAPQGVQDILLLVKDNTSMSANPFLQARITSKNFNLRQHHLSPISSTFYNFEDTSSIGTVNSSSKASTPRLHWRGKSSLCGLWPHPPQRHCIQSSLSTLYHLSLLLWILF